VLTVVRHGLALAGVTLLLVSGCSDDDGATTTTGAGVPSSSSSSLPAATTTVALSATTSPTTTAPTAPAVAEAGGWRIVITAPTALATIGPALDLCYEATGTAREADIAFEVGLVLAATGTVVSRVRVDATVGRGSARVNLGTPEARRYDMPVQAIVNGQRLDGLAVVIRGVVIGSAPPAGCA
jgi:hypothetical protein